MEDNISNVSLGHSVLQLQSYLEVILFTFTTCTVRIVQTQSASGKKNPNMLPYIAPSSNRGQKVSAKSFNRTCPSYENKLIIQCFVDAELKLPRTGRKTTLSNLCSISFCICQQCDIKHYLIVPELKKGQILHLSAGVTLRLYSGNRVWKEVYSHKRAMFCNQIKRRHSWFS